MVGIFGEWWHYRGYEIGEITYCFSDAVFERYGIEPFYSERLKKFEMTRN